MIERLSRMAATALLLAACSLPARAFMDAFIDPSDGQLDISNWLIDREGFLPVPLVVTEPAVGLGGGVALMFVRNPMRESAPRGAEAGRKIAPDVWVLGGIGTENGTRAGFAGGMMSLDDDRWRYRGGVARADVNLAFYGVGGKLGGNTRAIDYALDGWVSNQQLLRRLGDSDNWFGLRWTFMDLNSRLQLNDPSAGLDPDEMSSRGSGLGLALEHDSRDNIFTPSSGWTGALDATFYDPRWGSDTRFQSYRGHGFAFWPVAQSLVLGARFDARGVSGRVPFYQLPFIELRGVPAARYQDDRTLVAETELRWDFMPRWSAIAFIGAGRAWGRRHGLSDAPSIVAHGVGIRYLIARRLGLWIGLDHAAGPEGGVTYLQVGHAWH